MDFKKYIGYSFDKFKSILQNENVVYDLIELYDTKKTKLGDDLRIVNINEGNNKLIIYIAYF